MQPESSETRQCRECGVTTSAFPHRQDGSLNGKRCNSCLAAGRRAERAARPPKPTPLRDRDLTEKLCNGCGLTKAVAQFAWNQRKWSSRCRECLNAEERAKRVAFRAVHPVAPRVKRPKPVRVPQPRRIRPFEERFYAKVLCDIATHCWLWMGYRRKLGYGGIGRSRAGNGMALAHRVAYELEVGPIPYGLEVDHLCRNPPCVNPSHLEPVTSAENLRRAALATGIRQGATHCPQGHPYDAENTVIAANGWRQCRECNRRKQSAYATRQRAYVPKPRQSQITKR